MRPDLPVLPRIAAAFAALSAMVFAASPATAAVYPHAEGAAVMADWVVLAFLVFFGCALLVFLVAVRRGYFTDLEAAKYYLLTVDEPDFYTPDWIKEAESDAERE
ncbi:hypothetical protein HKCCE3408_11190 [Rhodobacterales bacterium HKCCE3408]|nr:hypothetical protein [Rhodobacterales bacterium HKCCE3408]